MKGLSSVSRWLSLVAALLLVTFLSGCLGGEALREPSKSFSVSGRIVDASWEGIPDVVLDFGSAGTVTTDPEGFWTMVGLEKPVKVEPYAVGYTFYPQTRWIAEASVQANFLGSQTDEPGFVSILAITDTHLVKGADGDPRYRSGTNWYYASHSNMRHMLDIVGPRDDPVLLVHLGDIVEESADGAVTGDWDFFRTIWDAIPIPTAIAIGNHDFDRLTYDELTHVLNYEERPEIAGSRFNETFVVGDGAAKAQVFIIDTNFDGQGGHTNTAIGRFTPAVLEWISNELDDPRADTVLFFSHHAPHHYNHPAIRPLFHRDSAMEFRGIVEEAAAAHPRLSMHYFHGHWHGDTLEVLETLGPVIPGYRIPATVHTETGYLVEIRADFFGDVELDVIELQYPY